MMKKLFIALILVLMLSNYAYCDFGGHSGNSDYGGGRSSGSDRSGGDRSSNERSGRENGFRSRSSYSHRDGDAVSKLSEPKLEKRDEKIDRDGVAFVAVAVGVLGFCIFRDRKKRRDEILTITKNLKPVSEYSDIEPDFDPQVLVDYISALYPKLQETWTAGNINPVQKYMTHEFFERMNNKLQVLNKNNQTDYTDDITVLEVSLKGWQHYSENYYMTAFIRTRIKSYIVDNLTGNIISGSRTREKFMTYEWDLMRNVNNNAKKSPDWIICNIKGLSQHTA